MPDRRGVIGVLAHCLDCPWECDDYITAQRRASRHAAETGHRVEAEITYVQRYGSWDTNA